jgi:RNA polymerase sigma-70 factor (ECF subfamily)
VDGPEPASSAEPVRALRGNDDSDAAERPDGEALRGVARDLPQIVARARAGERAAFDEFHGRFARFVHSVLLAHAPPSEIDDLHQEVFMAAWRNLGSLQESERAGAWLAAIARHAAQRRRATLVVHRARELPAQLADPKARAGGGLDGARLLTLLRELPEAYRETLALRLVEGFTGPEIAEATGLTHGSVRVNLHRGMQLLRERLREEGFE